MKKEEFSQKELEKIKYYDELTNYFRTDFLCMEELEKDMQEENKKFIEDHLDKKFKYVVVAYPIMSRNKFGLSLGSVGSVVHIHEFDDPHLAIVWMDYQRNQEVEKSTYFYTIEAKLVLK